MIRFTLDSGQFRRLLEMGVRQAEALETHTTAIQRIALAQEQLIAALDRINATLVTLNPPEDQRIPARAAFTVGTPQEE